MNARQFYCSSALVLSLVGIASGVNAATTPNSVVTVQTPTLGLVQSNAANNVTIYTAGANGSACFSLTAANTCTSTAYNVQVFVTRSAVNYYQTTVAIPAGAGAVSTALNVNMFNSATWQGLPLDNYGNPYLFLKSGDTLTATPTVSTSTYINLTSVCGDF